MRESGIADKEDWSLRGYMNRLRSLERSEPGAEDLLAALNEQIWIVHAIVNTGGSPAVQSMARRLLLLIEGASNKAEHTKRAVASLLSTWQEEQEIAHAGNKKAYKWAAWSSASAMVSTIFAILLGREGIIPAIQKGVQSSGTGAHPVASASGGVVAYSQSDFSIAVLHVLVIGLFLLLRFTNLNSPRTLEESVKGAAGAFNQFQRGWELIWLSWLALYVWFALIWGLARFGFVGVPTAVFWSVADLFNVGSAVAFLYTFLVMDMPSLRREGDLGSYEKFRATVLFSIVVGSGIFALSVLGRFNLWGLEKGGPVVQSMFVAICMAYFFGRLDSHYLKASRWMLVPFYLYVVIQVDWVSLATRGSDSMPILLSLALILKVYLFVVMTYWIHSGYIHAYLTMAASAHERVEKELLSQRGVRAPES